MSQAAESEALRWAQGHLRAEHLLLACLTPGQQQDYAQMKSFLVTGSKGGMYRVCWAYVYAVPKGTNFCILPAVRDLPPCDVMLMMKLCLQHDEDLFLSIANNGKYKRPWWRRWWAKIRRRRK